MSTARCWSEAFAEALNQGYSAKVVVSKSDAPEPPNGFEPSWLAFDFGADTSYRDPAPAESYHLREYADAWTVELDRYNPHHHPVRHAIADLSACLRTTVHNYLTQ